MAVPAEAVTASEPRFADERRLPQQQQTQQLRWNWQAVIRRRRDQRTGKPRYEDWGTVVRAFKEPELPDGTSLLERHLSEVEHIKPTELKRRLNAAKIYRRSVKRVDDLTKYIKFMQEENGSK